MEIEDSFPFSYKPATGLERARGGQFTVTLNTAVTYTLENGRY